jgi:hypothetical protein
MAEKRFENKEMQKRFDESRPKSGGGGEHAGKKTAGAHKSKQMDENSIEEHVEEHGPADHVEIHSHHGGAVHKSVHHSAHEAKAHIDKAFGENPMGENNEQQEAMAGTDSAPSSGGAPQIPTMA